MKHIGKLDHVTILSFNRPLFSKGLVYGKEL